jgi:FAD/FMN-containing dehydrogenase/Fe-S oxidoreductase
MPDGGELVDPRSAQLPKEGTVTASPSREATDLEDALRRAGVADVSTSTLTRAAYSSDASLYRLVPAAVVRPRDAAEVAATLAVCRERRLPLTCRGGGTSIAGNAVGSGVVVDFSRHMNAVLALDPEAGTATVQPGLVHAALQRAAAPAGLRFGPDPSSHTRCTVGGMIGNNACGSRALRYGRTSDNVVSLDVLTADGRPLRLDGSDREAVPGLADLVASDLATVRTEFGRFGRQVSGYALEHLLPERGVDVRRLLVGSEGTLAVVVGATVRLVAEPAHRVLVVLGYPDMHHAADAAPRVLEEHPVTCEGLDSRITDLVRSRRGAGGVPALPGGGGWLFVEVAGPSEGEALAAGRRVVAGAGAVDSLLVTEAAHAAALWRIREDGAGIVGVTAGGGRAYPGWEDSAVPPERLGAYLRDLDALLAEHHLHGVPYGHFGDGCLHLRLDFPLSRPDGPRVLRAFVTEAAVLVAGHGGSLSGEHGDGRTRGELLGTLYSPEAIGLFGAVKSLFDPQDLLNPGVLVRPDPLDAHLRLPATGRPAGRLAFSYHEDRGDFAAAVHRCSGVGKCRADSTATGGVMCPSYLATRAEKDSTRGRARVLQEMLDGSVVTGGWRSPEIHAALDLCLSCKACSTECPAGVDMASYKAEVLHQAYRHRLRPRSHYALGQLPRWARLAARAPGVANAAFALPGAGRVVRYGAGVDRRRALPRFAPRTFRDWFASRSPAAGAGSPVTLFVDTFTNHFSPEVGVAAVEVLESAGLRVSIPARDLCCALTWISTGQLDAARRIAGRTISALLPLAEEGIPIVGLEPSCLATLRSDAVELWDTPEARRVAAATRTLAEVLTGTGWQPPALTGREIVAQPHCHHSAVLGWDADAALLRRTGASVTRVGGCCGLAGNFGMERGHYEVSVAVAENALLPAVRGAGPDAVVLADGFSCRTQLQDLAGRSGLHLAQLLAGAGGAAIPD